MPSTASISAVRCQDEQSRARVRSVSFPVCLVGSRGALDAAWRGLFYLGAVVADGGCSRASGSGVKRGCRSMDCVQIVNELLRTDDAESKR